MNVPYSLPSSDLDFISSRTERIWQDQRGKNFFLSGGTGFFGIWLLESFCYANRKFGLGGTITVLTRNLAALRKRLPHLFDFSEIRFIEGDIRHFEVPAQNYDFIIHAATASAEFVKVSPFEHVSTIVDGTRRILEFAKRSKIEKFLYVSSGAVYGDQPGDVTHISENFAGSPNPLDLKSTYAESKRLGEHLSNLYGNQSQFGVTVARPFAFVGPYLPLNAHFALGNFMQAAIDGKPIQILGDGTPCRSYLDAADLTVWLWTLLFRGRSGEAYNVGSEHSVTLRMLAELIAKGKWLKERLEVHIHQSPIAGAKVHQYVPSTKKARLELGLEQTISLEDSILRMAKWYQRKD